MITRTRIVLLFMLLFSQAIAGDSNRKRPGSSPDCLRVCAKAMIGNEVQTGVSIKLYCHNTEIARIDSTEFEKVYFTLKRDEYYTIEISKAGYVPRLIGISTAVPRSVPLKPVFRFEFEVEMLKEMSAADDFYLDFPIALVSFDKKNECFGYSKKYTNQIKREISRMRQEDPVANGEKPHEGRQ